MGTIHVMLFVVAIAILFVLSAKGSYQYAMKPLLTDNEKEFLRRMQAALPGYFISCQVSFGALLDPKAKEGSKEHLRIRGTFSQKIADYVVCDHNLNVIAVVELDDKTHKASKDRARDRMLTSAGYRVIRWNSNKKPSIAEITAAFNQREGELIVK